MGHGNASAITAIGDAVNTASRLESLTKNFACELVVSEETVSRAGFDLSEFPLHEIEIRGKREILAIRTLSSAGELPATAGVLIPQISSLSNPQVKAQPPEAPRDQQIPDKLWSPPAGSSAKEKRS